MKQEFETFVAEMRAFRDESRMDRDELRSWFRRMTIQMVSLAGDVATLREQMVTKAEFHAEIGPMKSALSAFAGEVEVSRRERALQDQTFWTLNERLNGHDARLTRLESKRRL
jgi:hypothetical protein